MSTTRTPPRRYSAFYLIDQRRITARPNGTDVAITFDDPTEADLLMS